MRPVTAIDPRSFGRRSFYASPAVPEQAEATSAWTDFKLFASTFIGGFLFVAVYLA